MSPGRGDQLLRTMVQPDDAELDAISGIYERGLTLDALARGESIAPLAQWQGTRACVLAARIAANAGSRSLALRLTTRARRQDSHSIAARVQYGYELLGYRGPVALWELLRDQQADDTGTAEDLADLHALKARTAAMLRDFDLAEHWLDSAERLAPGQPWIRLQRAHLLEYTDNIEEALALAVEACSLHRHPYYRPGIQVRAHLLQLLDRDDDAIELLSQASAQLQNAAIVAQLHALYAENDRWNEAAATLQRYPALAPLLDSHGRRWLAAEWAKVKYRLGDRAAAARHAADVDDEFHRKFHDPPGCRAAAGRARPHRRDLRPPALQDLCAGHAGGDRTLLAHAGGAPAACRSHVLRRHSALAAARLGGKPWLGGPRLPCHLGGGHRVAPPRPAICHRFSGHLVRAHDGRHRVRPGAGHALAARPRRPYVVEVPAQEFFDSQRAFGPHGTLFIPRAGVDRSSDFILPDEALHDSFHRLSLALSPARPRRRRGRTGIHGAAAAGLDPDAGRQVCAGQLRCQPGGAAALRNPCAGNIPRQRSARLASFLVPQGSQPAGETGFPRPGLCTPQSRRHPAGGLRPAAARRRT